MKTVCTIALMSSLLPCLSLAVTAQSAQISNVAAPSSNETVEQKYVVKEGSEVNLKFAQDLSSKTATVRDPIRLLLDDDLKVGDVVVARKGSQVNGTITHAKKAGMMGKAGELNMNLEYLKAGDTRVRLRGTQGREGEGKVGTAVALTVLFGPVGLIKHGKNVEVKEGTPLKAYIDQDTTLLAAK